MFIFSVGFYVTPALLGGLRDTMLAMLIATQIQELLKWGFAGALSLILLVVTLALFLAFNRIMGLDRIWGGDQVRDERPSGVGAFRLPAPARRALALVRQALMEGVEWLVTAPAQIFDRLHRGIRAMLRLPARRARRTASGVGLSVTAGAIVVFLLAPIVLIFPVSFTNSLYLKFPPSGFSLQWYRELVETPYWTESLWLSLRVAPVSMLLAVALGTMGAVALARARFPFKDAVFSFILSPIIVPVIVTAVRPLLLLLPARAGGLVLGPGDRPHRRLRAGGGGDGGGGAQGFRHPPGRTPPMSLGASRTRAFFDVTLPIVRPAIIVSAFFAFIHSVRRGGHRLVRRWGRQRDPCRCGCGWTCARTSSPPWPRCRRCWWCSRY